MTRATSTNSVRAATHANHRLAAVGLAALLLAFAGGTAAAQGQGPAKRPPTEEGVLSGPKVTPRDQPGKGPTFDGAAQRGERPIPQQVFMRSIEQSLGKNAPANLRLTDQQRAQIETIDRDSREQLRQFMETNRAELNKLREQLGERAVNQATGETRRPERAKQRPLLPKDGEPAAKPGNADKPMDQMDQMDRMDRMDQMDKAKPETGQANANALAERARQLRELAPKMEDQQAKIWAVLSEPQKTALKTELEKFRKEMNEREARRYVERRLRDQGQKAGAPGEPPRPGQTGGPAANRAAEIAKLLPPPGQNINWPELREKLPEPMRQRLDKALEGKSDAQQQEILKRAADRLRAEAAKPAPQGPADNAASPSPAAGSGQGDSGRSQGTPRRRPRGNNQNQPAAPGQEQDPR